MLTPPGHSRSAILGLRTVGRCQTEMAQRLIEGWVRGAAIVLLVAVAGCSDDPPPIGVAPAPLPQQPIPPDDGGSDPPPAPDVAAISQCPASAATSVGTNTHLYAEFANSIDPASVPADGLEVQCGGQAVDGTLQVESNRLAFAPSAGLVAGSDCTATVAGGMRDTEGTALEAASWAFAVGEDEAFDWSFRPRTTVPSVSMGVNYIRKVLYGDGHLIVVIAVGRYLYVAVSDDSAATFQISEPLDVLGEAWGTVEVADAAYASGRLHLFWRALPVNTRYSEVWYTHSTTDLLTFEAPQVISSPTDYLAAMEVHVALNGERVYLTWREECPYGSDQCYQPNLQGLHMLVRKDGGDTFERREQLTGINKYDPLFAWINNSLVMTWVDKALFSDDFAIQVVDYAAGLTPVDQVSGLRPHVRSRSFFETTDGNGILHWEHTWDRGAYIADYNSTTRTLSAPRLLMSAPADQHEYYCSKISMDPQGGLAWLSVLSAKSEGASVPLPAERTVRLSNDGGATFGAPIRLDFLLPQQYLGTEYESDALFPFIAAKSDKELYVVWEHNEKKDGAVTAPVQATSGTPVPQCTL